MSADDWANLLIAFGMLIAFLFSGKEKRKGWDVVAIVNRIKRK